MNRKSTYLGDGLYASFDGFQIRLFTPRADGEHEVFLDHSTLAQFMAYVVSIGIRTSEGK